VIFLRRLAVYQMRIPQWSISPIPLPIDLDFFLHFNATRKVYIYDTRRADASKAPEFQHFEG
jgi:hypothetical protein